MRCMCKVKVTEEKNVKILFMDRFTSNEDQKAHVSWTFFLIYLTVYWLVLRLVIVAEMDNTHATGCLSAIIKYLDVSNSCYI